MGYCQASPLTLNEILKVWQSVRLPTKQHREDS